MITNKIDKCFTLDSDVLLFEDVSEDFYKNYSKYVSTLVTKSNGEVVFVGDSNSLKNYCKLTYGLFTQPKLIKKFDKIWSDYKKKLKSGSISDMTAWVEYYKKYFFAGGRVAVN